MPQITPNKAVSSSSKKLNAKQTLLIPSNSNEVSHHNETAHERLPECFMLIDTRILKDVVSNTGTCPICSNKINLSSDLAKKQGLAFLLEFRCERCHWNQKYYTSKQTEISKYKTPFEINARAMVAVREIGKGLTSLKMLCGYLNMPPPMQIAAFNSLQTIVGKAYETVVTDSMNNAAHELFIHEKGSKYVIENNI